VNDFTDPNPVLDQNHFIAQVNTLYTNTIVTRASQLWIHGFANASSQLLCSRIFCSGMCENSLSPENREGRHRMLWSFRVMRQCCSVSSYMASHTGVQVLGMCGVPVALSGKALYTGVGCYLDCLCRKLLQCSYLLLRLRCLAVLVGSKAGLACGCACLVAMPVTRLIGTCAAWPVWAEGAPNPYCCHCPPKWYWAWNRVLMCVFGCLEQRRRGHFPQACRKWGS